MMLVDSHCHIDGEKFDADRDEVVQRALDAGVGIMLNIGTGDPNTDNFRRAVAVAEKYPSTFFVLIDGWNMLAGSLVKSFGV